MKTPQTLLADQIIAQIAEIDRQINNLNQERQNYERLLVRARRQDAANREVTRKNSVGRILAEKAVLDTLAKSSGKGISSDRLFDEVRAIDPFINPTTFRSHLHRLKTRGLIQNSKNRRGVWELPAFAPAGSIRPTALP